MISVEFKSAGILGVMNRYPAPFAQSIFSDETRIAFWTEITEHYAMSLHKRGVLREKRHTPNDGHWLYGVLDDVRPPTPQAVTEQESRYGHEIVGFLAAYLKEIPSELQPYFHYGLTSSDLTEFALHSQIKAHAGQMASLLSLLRSAFIAKTTTFRIVPRAGRTHGQTAERTSLGHQFRVYCRTIRRLETSLTEMTRSLPIKTPGPTGVSTLVEPLELVGSNVVPSTQIIPRDYLLEWATIYLRVANLLDSIGTFVRLGARSEIGEFTEGGVAKRQGSSAMPGKKNPIESERICGLARIARGDFLAIAEVSNLWEDRDLSNSSTERIAVPNLASTVEHMTTLTTKVIEELQIHTERMYANSNDERCEANDRQNKIQRDRWVNAIEASEIARGEGARHDDR